jgi:hypothetical protein
MISKFHIDKDIVSSFRQDADTKIIYMTVGTPNEHLEIELPLECTDDFIALSIKLEEQKIALVASMAQVQLMMQGHAYTKSISALCMPPPGERKK